MVLFIVLHPALAPAFSSSLSALHAMLPRAPLICSAQRPGDERADRCLVASRQARGTVSKLQTRGSRALPAKGREERGQQREGVGPPCRPGGLHLPWSRRPGTGSPPQHHLGRNLPDLGGENTAPTPPFLPGSVGIRLDELVTEPCTPHRVLDSTPSAYEVGYEKLFIKNNKKWPSCSTTSEPRLAAQAGRLLKWDQASLTCLLRQLLGGSASLPAGWPQLRQSPPLGPSDTGPGDWEEAGGEAKAPSCGPTSQGCSLGDDMVPCTDRPPGPGG
uniref:Uncharacterized protein n=1 Tax=Rangifer tarandus platyrhynchus TaxID=3082113 RepID=A0ACB0ERT2_RANTA|nr:unnamed protein product [Rangifer tarandus platyrhynchus]